MDRFLLRPVLVGNQLAEGFQPRAGTVVCVARSGVCPVWDPQGAPVLRDATDRPRGVWLVVLQRPAQPPVCLEGADWDDVRTTLARETGAEPEEGQPVREWERLARAAGTKATVLHTPTADARF